MALGYDASLYKTAAFALSGAVACLAGALYGTHADFVSPSLAGVLFSTRGRRLGGDRGPEFSARRASRRRWPWRRFRII